MMFTVLTAGAALILEGELTAGELVSFYSLMSYFASPLSQITDITDGFNEAKISLERLRDITLLDPEPEGGLDLPLVNAGKIEFRDVCFSYPGCPKLLEHFNLTVPAARITAIRGESGCGKSSLAALLMRDYAPVSGKILRDDTDIALIPMAKWRRYVSIVPQEPALMNCSVLDNITGFGHNPDLEKVAGI